MASPPTQSFVDPSIAASTGRGTRATITLTAATFTTGTWNLSETNAFTSYTWATGDRIYISGGTACTVGYYTIASKTDASNIILSVDITTDASSPTDVTSDSAPYGDLQYAFNTITRDTTDGDQINIKAGTAEFALAAISLTTFTVPSNGAPLIVRGYTTTANDGGIGVINCNGSGLWSTKYSYMTFVDMEIYNSGTGHLFWCDNYCHLLNCYLHTTTSGIAAYMSGSYNSVVGCRIENVGGYPVFINIGGLVYGNYIDIGTATSQPIAAIRTDNADVSIVNNIIVVDSTTDGVYSTNSATHVLGNTILSAAGTGTGVYLAVSGVQSAAVFDNYVEGFSGAGGVGYDYVTSSAGIGSRGFNAAYFNTTNLNLVSELIIPAYNAGNADPEVLSVTGLSKSGAATFANRLTYFAPVVEGGMQDGAMQPGGEAG